MALGDLCHVGFRIFVEQLPESAVCSLVDSIIESAHKSSDDFVTEEDAWRNSRFKVLPHVVEGGYLVKKAVGMTPCLIGNKGKSTYYSVGVAWNRHP